MKNELENKIRKAIPELQYFENITNYELSKKNNVTLKFGLQLKPIQLNHVLMYALETETYKKAKTECWDVEFIFQILQLWNLKSNLLSDQSEEIYRYLLELKNDSL